ncbi:uncharacterized protein LOC122080648 [Macadamia integrifolia]|uniref:uncharacterized protein LOC122080648 n=1 Tax=Macadamia integrifolia TaxID=60698 RepID=UPI001C4F26A0|nr:uncharacterized protein LOC122080648 [Macadamia integrifolia]XP_042503386.1 uncharacterized protein LOC122080648 [Macadamia integrifolia]
MQAMQERRPEEQKEHQCQLNDHNQFHQNVIVMRHGDRVDNLEPLWITTARRPWDPPLAESGRIRAFCTGRKLRDRLDFPIHRVFVSPFLRCIQTAFEVVSALCAVQDNNIEMTSENVPIEPSKLKVSIEYGLCEVLSKEAITSNLTPKDGNWGFDISKLEKMLPAGTVDHSIERVYQELPKWEESLTDARARYKQVIHALADKYPCENLLFITHGEGVGIAVSAFMKDTTVYEVEYCGYAHTRREITFKTKQTFTASNFEVSTKGSESGISYCPISALAVDA